MAKRKSSRTSPATLLPEAVPLKFDQKLVLLQWLLWLFDKKSFEQLAEPFKSAQLEGLNEDNNHKFLAVFKEHLFGLEEFPGDVLLGRDLAEDLGVGIGDTVRLSTPGSTGDTYRVRGIFDLGAKNLNQLYAYVGLATAQALHALPGGVTSIEVTVGDLWDAERVAADLSRTIPHLVESWIRTNRQLMVALANQTLMTRMIRMTFGLVVAIGVASVLMVAVVQKTREIGILRAMGTSRRRVLRVFLLQGAIIGLIGSVLGCALGYGLAWFMSGILTSADGTRLFTAQVDLPLYLYTTVGAIVLGVVAAMLPARRAARLDPAQAIRM